MEISKTMSNGGVVIDKGEDIDVIVEVLPTAIEEDCMSVDPICG